MFANARVGTVALILGIVVVVTLVSLIAAPTVVACHSARNHLKPQGLAYAQTHTYLKLANGDTSTTARRNF